MALRSAELLSAPVALAAGCVALALVAPALSWRRPLFRTTLGEAVRSGAVTLDGPARLQRAFGGWFAWSALAPAVRGAPARRAAVEGAGAPDHRVSVSL